MKKVYLRIADDDVVKKTEGRKAIFLDSNIWIHIADEKICIAKKIKEDLIRLVNNGMVFCPLSAPLIWELRKQNFESALRVGRLMKKLSFNITYMYIKEIFEKEVENYIFNIISEKEPILIKDIYAPFMAYLCSKGVLSFPNIYSEREIKQFCDMFIPIMNNIKLTEFIKLTKDNFSVNFKSDKLSFLKQNKRRWEFTKGDKEKMRRLEEEYVAQNIIFPMIGRLPIYLQFKLISHAKSLPRDKYGGCMETMLKYMPAINCTIDVMTVTGYDITRKDSMNDFFDRDMMITPLAYADVFVSDDKWIRHLLNNVSDIASKNGTKYISKLDDFEEYLQTITN